MYGYVGYNEIKMDPTDIEKTAFRTPFGNFMYTVMPFRFKNACATYQRTMMAIFDDLFHKTMMAIFHDLKCVVPRAIKSQAYADLLAIFPSGTFEPSVEQLPGDDL